MEFWGVEVKPNQTLKCEPGDDKLLHLSLASLAESKKTAENVVLYVTFNNQKLAIGTLSAEKCPQINHDLIFEKEFELSHNSKSATVNFIGYKSIQNDDMPSDFDDVSSEEEEEEEEEAKVASKTNGSLKIKPDSEKVKVQKAKAGKPLKAEQKDDEDSDDDEDDSDDDEDMEDAGDSDDDEDESDDEDEDDEDSSEAEEETPEPAKKKRAAEAAKKSAEPEKKAKLATPADGKKGGEAKKGTATPAKGEKSDKGKQQTPKSASAVSCKSCSKTFNSEAGLESHTKAKHSAK